MVSRQLITKLKLSDEPAYRIAQRAGIDPTILSKLIHGAVRIKPNDQRVLAVGEILGLPPHECFSTAVH